MTIISKKTIILPLILSYVSGMGPQDWQPCERQDCSSTGWICCDVTQLNENNVSESTGFMICTDPNAKGIVPNDVDSFGGR